MADDFVCLFKFEEESRIVYELLKYWFAKFELELVQDKSRILPFGRNSDTTYTLDFLGFTNANDKYTIGHKISKKKNKVFKTKLKKLIKEKPNTNIKVFSNIFNLKL